MNQSVITKIETTYIPDGTGGYTEETREIGSYDVKLGISNDKKKATAYGVQCEQILEVIADEPMACCEGSFWIIIGQQGPQGPAGGIKFEELTDEQKEELRGPQGIPGPQGPEGPEGKQGPEGPKGADGTMTFEDLTPEQKESLRGPQGEQGPEGPASTVPGPQGPAGADGVSPIVSTLEVEEGTVVSITDKDGIKSFTVKNGTQGPKGDKGDKGDTGEQGPKGDKGDPGANGSDYVITNADYDAIATVVLSKMTNAEQVRY